MDIFTFFLLLCWTIAGVWLLVGELPRFQKHRIEQIFSVRNRWGKLIIGAFLLTFCSFQVYLWAIDPLSTWELLWAPLKLSY